jgi:hypothetical protein
MTGNPKIDQFITIANLFIIWLDWESRWTTWTAPRPPPLSTGEATYLLGAHGYLGGVGARPTWDTSFRLRIPRGQRQKPHILPDWVA